MSSDTQPTKLQLDDATAVIVLEKQDGDAKRSQKTYRLYRGLIERLSPTFFSSVVDPLLPDYAPPIILSSSPKPTHYILKKGYEVLEDELDVLEAYLLHDTDIYSAPFQTLLTLFVVTSTGKCNFPSTHKTAAKRLEDLVFHEPDLLSLRTDLLDGGQKGDERKAVANIERALCVAESNLKLSKPLRSLLYYSCTILDDSENVVTNMLRETEQSIESVQISSDSESHETHITHFLTEKLSDAISPTLFTPPAAQHMPCTNAIAHLWSSRAILPVLTPSTERNASSQRDEMSGNGNRLTPRGMADAFGMLRAWVEDDWVDGEIADSEDVQGPCEECLEFLKEEWRSEARAIWGKMDQWIDEAERRLENSATGVPQELQPNPS